MEGGDAIPPPDSDEQVEEPRSRLPFRRGGFLWCCERHAFPTPKIVGTRRTLGMFSKLQPLIHAESASGIHPQLSHLGFGYRRLMEQFRVTREEYEARVFHLQGRMGPENTW